MGDSSARIRKELVDFNRDFATSGVSAEPVDGRLDHLHGQLRGPKDSPYEGGTFHVDIFIPREYPFQPPKMKFTTPIWHPNISSQASDGGRPFELLCQQYWPCLQTGAICLDILKDAWSPALTIKTALVSLQALLSAPEPNDPQARHPRPTVSSNNTCPHRSLQDAEVATQYKRDNKGWQATAKYWTEAHAMPKKASSATAEEEKVATLVSMGFPREDALRALRTKAGNLEAALEKLVSS
jgi:ubiquitin-conjugating enzyme (huntingtin interacting protein 2)